MPYCITDSTYNGKSTEGRAKMSPKAKGKFTATAGVAGCPHFALKANVTDTSTNSEITTPVSTADRVTFNKSLNFERRRKALLREVRT